METQFVRALEAHSLEGVRAAPKSDLHSHAGRGGRQAYIAAWAGVTIARPAAPFDGLGAMQAWFEANVKVHCPGLAGHLKRLEAAFVQARADGIAVLAMSFAEDEVRAMGGMASFMATIDALHRQYAPDTVFLPELSFGRESNPDDILGWLDEMLSPGWFASVDICNDELAQPIERFARVYEAAGAYGVRKRAHVGEFGTAEDVREAVEALALDEVQHGIAAASSPQVMRWLARHHIQLNVCPTSNLLLGRTADYRTHPIVALVEHGVPVTINTDDLLIFDSSVSEEYIKLYEAGALSAQALDLIRQTGLRAAVLSPRAEGAT